MRKPGRGMEILRVRFLKVLLSLVFICVVIMSLQGPDLFKPRLVTVPSSNSQANSFTFDPPGLQKMRRHLADPKDDDHPAFSEETPTMFFSPPDAAASLPSPKSTHALLLAAEVARADGRKMSQLIDSKRKDFNSSLLHRFGGTSSNSTQCPQVLILSGDELRVTNNVMVIPCGLMSGSSITLVGRPKKAHAENSPHIRMGETEVMVSQFMVELRGLKLVDGEDPPRILHVNPRLSGDWSRKSVIELNTCYRGQWGTAQRCEGWLSEDEEYVDRLPKCEHWLQDDENKNTTETTNDKSSWLNKLIPKTEKGGAADWGYPFMEQRLFVMTIRAGWEGYHVSVDGRHITSFPYRTGFILGEATGFAIMGDVDVRSVVGTSLPSTHSLTSEQVLEESEKYKAPLLPPTCPVHLFIGILSASNHFAERMAVRKTWMQSETIRSSQAVARFFVALHTDLEINLQVREEAEYFGDMVILPFIDHYDLVVLKTVAICEYAVRNMSANYIMKTDDDTFVRVDILATVLSEKVREAPGLYIGNINQFHRPLREGKWAVTYEEWPEEEYPPYANGPGYIISSDIAKYILEQERNSTLRLFKMEDVSMGMWVLQFNANQAVHYIHNLRFCQWGCIEDYYTAHYQSPRQMLCMWDKLQHGEALCCNMR